MGKWQEVKMSEKDKELLETLCHGIYKGFIFDDFDDDDLGQKACDIAYDCYQKLHNLTWEDGEMKLLDRYKKINDLGSIIEARFKEIKTLPCYICNKHYTTIKGISLINASKLGLKDAKVCNECFPFVKVLYDRIIDGAEK